VEQRQGGLGIPQIDHLLGVPPRGSTVLFVNDPGVEALEGLR
jgi:hypothetical protein